MHGRRKVPQGWCVTRLDELAKFNPEQIGDSTSPDTVIDYIDLSAVEETGACPTKVRMTFRDAPSRARRKVSCGDILASTVRPYLRGFTRLLESTDDTITVASTGYSVIRPLKPLDGEFIYQHVLSGEFVTWLLPLMTGSGYPAVSESDMAAYPILCPPPSERQRIGDMLAAIDSAIDQTRGVIEQTRRVKTALLQDLLTHGLPGRHAKFQKHKIGVHVPVDWNFVPLPQAAPYQNGKAVPSSDYGKGSLRLLRPGNLHISGRVMWDDAHTTTVPDKYASSASGWLVHGNELVMNLTAQSLEDQFLGRVCWTTSDSEPALLNQRIARFRSNGCHLRFLYWTFRGPVFRTYVDRLPQGSKVQHLYNSNLDGFMVPLPKEDEQLAITEALDCVQERELQEVDVLQRLIQTKNALNQALLTGRIRVKTEG